MARSASSNRREIAIAAGISVVAAAIFAVLVLRSPSDPGDSVAIVVRATGLDRDVVYRSPQRPGYTAWTGTWLMPDRSLMVAFTQATGPVDPRRRRRAPSSVLRRLEATELDPRRNFWGLRLSVKYLRSTDGGTSWRPAREDRFRALAPQAYSPQATFALRDGAMLRRVNGHDLRFDDALPHTAFLQWLEPGAEEWGRPQVLLDPRRFTYQLSRLRRLRDGRIIGLGQRWDTPAGSSAEAMRKAPARLLLVVSGDEGRTWREALEIPEDSAVVPNEWDAAELSNGDLLGVMRSRDANGTAEIRKQGLLRKDGDGWVLSDVRNAPLPHSGHPELLAAREGVVLHIASTGVHYTSDAGDSWRPLRFPGGRRYTSQYYPRAVQTGDGVVHVFSHVGGDNAYGEADQRIIGDRFRLITRRP